MPKNSAMARMIPVYQGRIVRVVKMRKRKNVGRVNIASFVLRSLSGLLLFPPRPP